ncbi:MAG: alpha/beta fold hydrolase [Candidatus Nanopelagicales bacterium]
METGNAVDALKASLPPLLPGLNPGWSRLVNVGGSAAPHTWHLLDSHATDPAEPVSGTLLCVHGNPTWSYLWRKLVAVPPPGWRVIAVDQLSMGYSQRVPARGFAQRVADLGRLTDELGLTGPVVTVGHDWGGAISLGWALAHRDQLAGVVLANTGVGVAGGTAPLVIRAARLPGILPAVTQRSRAFIAATLWDGLPAVPKPIRSAYFAPYEGAQRRAAIQEFVADIPLASQDPSGPALAEVAGALSDLAAVPALLLWGPRDVVFGRPYLLDMISRLPQAEVQVYPECGHLVPEQADTFAEDVATWVRRRVSGRSAPVGQSGQGEREPLWAAVSDPARAEQTAICELRDPAAGSRLTTFGELAQRISAAAGGLDDLGVRAGDRVALLVPPGAELTVSLFSCWRIGAIAVVVDAGLGLRGMRSALRSAAPKYLIGSALGLAAVRVLGLSTCNVLAEPTSLTGAAPGSPKYRALAVTTTLARLEEIGSGRALPAEPGSDEDALIAFTSGATGPSKGVRYQHGQLAAQRDLIAGLFQIKPADRLVAAFAPFALFATALGITCVVPRMDLTSPATLTAVALSDAVQAIGATMVFASPAALMNIVATADKLPASSAEYLRGARALLSAGAPVPPELLAQMGRLLPNAAMHTPYGMTECLTVADIDLPGLLAAGEGNGVCVGHPLAQVRVAISPLDPVGAATGPLTTDPGVTGEVLVGGPNVMAGYDRRWRLDAAASRDPGFHRTGDVGHLDTAGRLWIEGRLQHVIVTPTGPLTPVGLERRVEALPAVRRAAVVGVGPAGTQAVVVILEMHERLRGVIAPRALREAVRTVLFPQIEPAAVLLAKLPVDIRHNSKIDRTRLARWAGRVLAGRRAGRP